MYNYVIGIDPGLKGGVAIFHNPYDTDLYEFYDIEQIPITKTKVKKVIKNKKTGKSKTKIVNKREISGIALTHILKDYSAYDAICILEEVHAMPKQGVTSMFNFGKTYGIIIGVLSALGIQIKYISPQKWKEKVLPNTAKDKQAAIDYCKKNFPDVNLLPTKRSKIPSDGLADALCLSVYGTML